MEPGIFSQLKRYFQSGGNPLQVIEELSQNYTAVAQMANLIAEWLIIGGRSIFNSFRYKHIKSLFQNSNLVGI